MSIQSLIHFSGLSFHLVKQGNCVQAVRGERRSNAPSQRARHIDRSMFSQLDPRCGKSRNQHERGDCGETPYQARAMQLPLTSPEYPLDAEEHERSQRY
jgi:hypothetical protein